MNPILLIAELTLLFFLSRRVIQTVFTVFFVLTRSRTIGIWIVTIIFFPGTVVHELAHLFTAEILGVHTGKLTLLPEGLEGPHFAKASWGEAEIKAGGIMIAETDPLRRTLIGLSPVYIGIGVLTALSFFIRSPLAALQGVTLNNMFSSPSLYIFFFILYILFAVSNSMFSSKEDMKGVLPFTITAAIFLIAGYFAGLRIGLTNQLLTGFNLVTETLVRSLGVVIAVNLAVLAAASLMLAFLGYRPHSNT